MNTSDITNKDILLNHISHGLIMCGVEFNKPATKRHSVKSLQARLTWLREYYVARIAKPSVPSTKCCTHCGQALPTKS